MKIKKGDKVKVIIGKDNGKSGVVEKVYIKQNKVIVTGLNIYKKHIKKNEKMPQGGVVEIPRSLSVNKVMIICGKCNKPTKIGYEVSKTGKKSRICKKCQSKI